MCIFYVSSINLSFQPHRKRQFYDLETLYDSKIVFNNPFRARKTPEIFIFTTFSWTFEPIFCADVLWVRVVLASLSFADMDNGGRDEFIFISLRLARLRIYIFIIDQPHLCFRLDTIEWSSFTNHYLWRHHPLSSLMRITRFHRQIFIQMEPKKYTQWMKKIRFMKQWKQ